MTLFPIPSLSMRCRLRSPRAAVLVEAVVSIVILAVTATVLIEALTGAFKNTTLNADYAKGLLLLDNQMSQLTRTAFLEKDLGPSRSFPPPYDRFEYSEKTTASALDPSGELREVHLQLSWKSGRKENEITLTTCLLKSPESQP